MMQLSRVSDTRKYQVVQKHHSRSRRITAAWRLSTLGRPSGPRSAARIAPAAVYAALAALLTLAPAPARAQAPIPRISRSAEQAFVPAASTNCQVVADPADRGLGIKCSDSATLTNFSFWTTFPALSQNASWGVTILYDTPAATSVCAWDVAIGALVDGSATDSANASTVVVSNSNQAHSANTLYKTNTATVGTKRLDTGAACNPQFGVCSSRPVRVDVQIDSGATTAANCTLKSIELAP